MDPTDTIQIFDNGTESAAKAKALEDDQPCNYYNYQGQ